MWANRGPGVSRGVSTSDLTSQGRGGVLQLPRLSLYSGPISWDYGMSKQAMHDYMPIEYEDMALIRGGTFWMGSDDHYPAAAPARRFRSEKRRVGKEWIRTC